MNIDIEVLVTDIAKQVCRLGGKAYYVGGYVRDRLLNIESKDIDIEIHKLKEEDLVHILSKYGKVKKVGASFGVYMIEGYDIDFSLPREEISTGPDHKDFEIVVSPYLGTKGAALRRDFTINSIMQEVLTEKIIDHFGGIQDLIAKRIRHVNDAAFIEDPLRVLRAAQFAARFDFTIDNDTLVLMEKVDISVLSHERIFEEIKKALLKSKKPSLFFNTLKSINQLDIWFKELHDLIGVKQSPIHHPEGDAYIHTMLVIDEAAKHRNKANKPLWFMLSALCHDLGKKRATVITPERITSHEHHKLGRDETRDMLSRITNEKKLLEYVDNMVYLHMKPRMLYKNDSKKNAYRRLIRDSIDINDLLLLVTSDTLGRKDPDIPKTMKIVNGIKENIEAVKDEILPVVLGRDLIALGYKPGKEIGVLLKQAYELQLDGYTKREILDNLVK